MSIDNGLAGVAGEMLPGVKKIYPNGHQLFSQRALAFIADKPHGAVPIVDEYRTVGLDFVDNLPQGRRRRCLIVCQCVRRHRHDRECGNSWLSHDLLRVLSPVMDEGLDWGGDLARSLFIPGAHKNVNTRSWGPLKRQPLWTIDLFQVRKQIIECRGINRAARESPV